MENNIFDFIIEVAKSEELGKEFTAELGKKDAASLSRWFQEKKYDVNEADCQKLVDNMDDLKEGKVGFLW